VLDKFSFTFGAQEFIHLSLPGEYEHTPKISVVHEDHHPKKKLIDGIFRKLMVYTGQFQT
jgi:hypothetical protein